MTRIVFPFHDRYSATEDGRVWTARTGTWEPMKPFTNEWGYLRVFLSFDGRDRGLNLLVNRVVCCLFNGQPPSTSHQAAHNNGNRQDNRAPNLRWATRSENNVDRKIHGTVAVGSRNGQSKMTEEQVLELRRLRSDGCSYTTLATRFGVSWHTARDACTGRGWKHVGGWTLDEGDETEGAT